jgi:hypothetical protein
MPDWFDVDQAGLARFGSPWQRPRRAAFEAGVTCGEVALNPIPGRPGARLRVLDNAPQEFARLRTAKARL